MSMVMILIDSVVAAMPPKMSASESTLIELGSVWAWPIVALIIAAMLRQPLSAFLGSIGGRITKLSVFKVELQIVPEVAANAVPLLDALKTASSGAEINDSSAMMQNQIGLEALADYAIIRLGDGAEWLTTRLFVAAVMLARMRGVRAMVFVERRGTVDDRFVVIASPDQLRWALARQYPWLELAWSRTLATIEPTPVIPKSWTLPMGSSFVTSDTGRISPDKARELVSHFVTSLQQPASPDPVAVQDGQWVSFKNGVSERATWVTREGLKSLLPPEAFEAWTDVQRDASRDTRTRAVLRRPGDFVALLESERQFFRLVNRRKMLDELAAGFADEPDRK